MAHPNKAAAARLRLTRRALAALAHRTALPEDVSPMTTITAPPIPKKTGPKKTGRKETTPAAARPGLTVKGEMAVAVSQRVEQASLNAWPALHQVVHDGWLLRFCNGFTRRANSVALLTPGSRPVDQRIDFCEALYGRANLRTVFRVTSLCAEPEVPLRLQTRGYLAEDPTHVLAIDTARHGHAPHPQSLARDAWLDAYGALSGPPNNAQQLHALLLKAIRLDCLFGAITVDGNVAACGLAVVEGDLVGIFDVVSAPALRQQGLGAQLVAGLLAWGAQHGASTGYLQVVQHNAPALRLYDRLGFTHLHDYRYLCAPR